jgi:hypothetical protein
MHKLIFINLKNYIALSSYNFAIKIIALTLFITSCKNEFSFNKSKVLTNYPSGSGIVCYNNKIYLIGDDVNKILITDTAFNIVDTIELFASSQKRIEKQFKQDIEAAAIVPYNKTYAILLVGSGSLNPYRNFGWLINPATKQKEAINLKPFYDRIKKLKIENLNIEGITAIPGAIVLASRGNLSSPENYLIFTTNNFWSQQETAEIKICKVVSPSTDTASFTGVSGLEYCKQSDQLLLTVSTEQTSSALHDGAIGKSYLWMINNISEKKRVSAVSADKIIDLDVLDKRIKGHKIESACIIFENKKEKNIALVADDDNVASTIFKVTIKN